MSDLKCGVEIHQRLASASKLFCNCPSDASADGVQSGMLRRRLRAVAGELGKIDAAAAFEANRAREFTYQLFDGSSCLVEQDEAPPTGISQDALEIALKVSLLLGARVFDEIHVMRKAVVDGSAVSGFQRTALVSLRGGLKTASGSVGIQSVSVEEESAGIVEQSASGATYRLDRLGVPLIEIATDATISSGKQALEASRAIGLLLRSTRRVQRGIGSIRQDLNVSVEGGARCEIKGAQELENIEALVDNEASRQRWLLWIKAELARRRPEGKPQQIRSVSSSFEGTKCALVKNGLAKGHVVMAVKLTGFAGLLGKELMPGHRFGTELSDYAKVSAGVSGIIHSDEDMGKYAISEAEKRLVANALSCGTQDAWVACVDSEVRAVAALGAVQKRALAAFDGVPKETRRAAGVASRFMRPLPSAARMYPETDVPPITITPERLAELRDNLPPSLEEIAGGYEKKGLSRELASEMALSEYASLFERACGFAGADAVFAASTLLQTLKALKREGVPVERVEDRELLKLLQMHFGGRVVKAGVGEAIRKMAVGGKPAEMVVREEGLERLSPARVRELARKLGTFEALMREHRLVVSPEDAKKAFAETQVRKFKTERS